MPTPQPPTTIQNVPITFSDGIERHLRYTLGDVKRIKQKWGADFKTMFEHPQEEMMPAVLWVGLIEKTDLTEEGLSELISIGSVEYYQLCFVEAFFGKKMRTAVEDRLREINGEEQKAELVQ